MLCWFPVTPPVILIVDDDANDVLFLQRAFERANVSCQLAIVRDGQEAIDYLSGAGRYGDRGKHPWPALVLLDLKMPMMDGFDVLSWWRGAGHKGNLPIIVMSTSALESDIKLAMELGATAYRVKPTDFEYLVVLVQELRDRWLAGEHADR
jgi:CheY-like chemotaxis protein